MVDINIPGFNPFSDNKQSTIQSKQGKEETRTTVIDKRSVSVIVPRKYVTPVMKDTTHAAQTVQKIKESIVARFSSVPQFEASSDAGSIMSPNGSDKNSLLLDQILKRTFKQSQSSNIEGITSDQLSNETLWHLLQQAKIEKGKAQEIDDEGRRV